MEAQTREENFQVKHIWRLLVVIFLLLAIYISTILGQSVTISFVTFTLYGSILLVRKVVQLTFAIKNNRKMMAIVREPIIAAIQLLEHDPAKIDKLSSKLRRYMPFDDFRAIAMQELNLSDKEWKELMLSTFSKEEMLTCDLSVPIYGVTPNEIRDQVESLVSMTYQFRNVYLELNGTIEVGGRKPKPLSIWKKLFNFLFWFLPKFQIDLGEEGQKVRDDVAWSTIVSLSEKYNSDPDVYTRFIPRYEPIGDKRGVMYDAFLESIKNESDLTGNIDGDTIVDRDALANTVRVFNSNPKWVCLTGDVRLLNPLFNLLTILTMIRYFNAFNIERAAQSLFEQMTVPSGPYFVYRTKQLAQIVHKWRFQQFLPKKPDEYCTFGDDRHTGTLALMMLWALGFLSEAIVWTEAPTKTGRWMLQQLRWARSAWRETYILFEYGMKNGFGFLNWFVLGDQIYLTFFPFLVLGVIIAVTTRAISVSFSQGIVEGFFVVLPYIVTILIVNWLFNSAYGLRIKGSLWFLLSPMYVLYWLFILTPVKFWGALTVNESGWTARTAEGIAQK